MNFIQKGIGVALSAGILFATSIGACHAQSSNDLILSGELLLRRHCARCHSVGDIGESPHPDAPNFRDISRLYPVESLAESLAEGLFVGHPDMPTFYFEAKEVDQIIEYLESIQLK